MRPLPELGTQAWLAHGQVRHRRSRPAEHAFAYPTCFLMLPMRAWRHGLVCGVPRNRRWSALSFADSDHGDGQADALAWVEAQLARWGIDDVDGEIWLRTYPRMWGVAFKPVSFWYCQRADGSVRGVLVEVNNTFGQRHVYWLDQPQEGVAIEADKAFHVSPFCQVQGRYRFVFMRAASAQGPRIVVRIDYWDDDRPAPLLQTSVSGRLQVATVSACRATVMQYGWHSFGVVLRIHWQALHLWRKGVPFFGKTPAVPAPISKEP